MLADQISTAIEAAKSVAALDHLAKLVWQGVSADALDDDQAHGLLAKLQQRRGEARANRVPVGIPAGRPSIFPPRRAQLSPRTPKCLARRRQLAASGPLPPQLAAHFTCAELAALMVVREEARTKGACDRSIAEIAARAGVGRTTVQNALRLAAKLCLLIVQERRRDGQKNLPNVLRIVSKEWLAWNATRAKAKAPRPIGFKLVNPTDIQDKRIEGFSRKRGRGRGSISAHEQPEPDQVANLATWPR